MKFEYFTDFLSLLSCLIIERKPVINSHKKKCVANDLGAFFSFVGKIPHFLEKLDEVRIFWGTKNVVRFLWN